MKNYMALINDIRAIAEVYGKLNRDPAPNRHLGSYVTTKLEPLSMVSQLFGARRNLVIHDYKAMEQMSEAIIRFMQKAFNAPDCDEAYGTLTLGSSEAVMLSGLCYCHPIREKGAVPNIVAPSTVHACIPKFAQYFGIELRMVAVQPGRMIADPDEIMARVDQNTGCIFTILGSTLTGHMDDIADLNQRLVRFKAQTGLDISIAVDAAIGGFVLPFTRPDILWDFRLEQVRSITTSNHKFGQVSAGLGTLVFKDQKYVPESLIYDIDYLGKAQQNFSLNFSRNSSAVIQQYCNLKRYGVDGYRHIAEKQLKKADYLKKLLLATGLIELVNDQSLLPAVYFRAKDESGFNLDRYRNALARHGYVIPVYAVPTAGTPEVISRIVVRSDFTAAMAREIAGIAKKTV